jgi:hypothetical protein
MLVKYPLMAGSLALLAASHTYAATQSRAAPPAPRAAAAPAWKPPMVLEAPKFFTPQVTGLPVERFLTKAPTAPKPAITSSVPKQATAKLTPNTPNDAPVARPSIPLTASQSTKTEAKILPLFGTTISNYHEIDWIGSFYRATTISPNPHSIKPKTEPLASGGSTNRPSTSSPTITTTAKIYVDYEGAELLGEMAVTTALSIGTPELLAAKFGAQVATKVGVATTNALGKVAEKILPSLEQQAELAYKLSLDSLKGIDLGKLAYFKDATKVAAPRLIASYKNKWNPIDDIYRLRDTYAPNLSIEEAQMVFTKVAGESIGFANGTKLIQAHGYSLAGKLIEYKPVMLDAGSQYFVTAPLRSVSQFLALPTSRSLDLSEGRAMDIRSATFFSSEVSDPENDTFSPFDFQAVDFSTSIREAGFDQRALFGSTDAPTGDVPSPATLPLIILGLYSLFSSDRSKAKAGRQLSNTNH